jgi:regulatory protein
LIQKGIDKCIIDTVFDDEYGEEQEDAELAAIRKAVAKKTDTPELLSYEQKQKLIASLYRKGFVIDKIKKIIS